MPDEVVLVPMDALLVEQVLLNLLENAVAHAEGMTRLSLSVISEGGKAMFTVEDDGCGIDEEKISRILEGGAVSFGESGDSKTRHAGIGLSVCATIIRAHGAKMTASNTSGGGARFVFFMKCEERENVE